MAEKHKGGMYRNFFKRPMDFVLSLMAIIALSPVFLIVAFLVRTQLGSPVLFKQERPGLDEKVFSMYKFRSMTDERDAEGNLMHDDVRLTGFGRALRSTSLDELPGLFNIVKGDMSIVGPRPLFVKYLPYYTESEKLRHSVRPGLTGLAQIRGRNNVDWEKRLTADLEYIQKISFLSDLKIILKTVTKVLKREDITNVDMPELQDLDHERRGLIDHEMTGNQSISK